MAQVIVAGGCFWCTEAVFRQLAGVSAVESGYIGGTAEAPTYKQVCAGDTGHAEASRISFDPAVLTLEDYHQEYWSGEGQRNSYCLAVIPPKLAKLRKGFADKLKD